MRRFEPLHVTAKLRGSVAMPNGRIAFDGLVGAAIVMRDGLAPATTAAECVPLDIPIAKSECGRLYLASVSFGEVEQRENRWINRRFPVPEAQAMAVPEFTRIRINAGAQKSYRLPLDTAHIANDELHWWCIGDGAEIGALLTSCVGFVGKKRGVGYGKVEAWSVEPCEPWDGFPVLRDGQPMRALPVDWPGLAADAERAYRTIAPPYWDRTKEILCAVPT